MTATICIALAVVAFAFALAKEHRLGAKAWREKRRIA